MADEHRRVIDALRQLSGRQKEAIVLKYYADLSEADDGEDQRVVSRTSSTTTTSMATTSPSTSDGQTSTTPHAVPPPGPSSDALVAAIWPPIDGNFTDPEGRFTDPVAAAASFLEVKVGLTDVPLGSFRGSANGEAIIPLFDRAEDGSIREDVVRSEIDVRTFDGRYWTVVEARSPNLLIDDPPAFAPDAGPPFTVTGRARGFEGTVAVAARGPGQSADDALAEEVIVAGSAGELAPFSVTLDFPAPEDRFGALIATTAPGTDTGVPDVTAIVVEFS